ncbi:hypothetical protein G6L37_00105 [Agrobacterium rubi]|nr:hypothetical protein [Agrobacterium rubi]NTF23652.1 hypothetical protein [Agrobacterium rubi]
MIRSFIHLAMAATFLLAPGLASASESKPTVQVRASKLATPEKIQEIQTRVGYVSTLKIQDANGVSCPLSSATVGDVAYDVSVGGKGLLHITPKSRVENTNLNVVSLDGEKVYTFILVADSDTVDAQVVIVADCAN